MKEITFTITENTEPVNALKTINIFVNRLEEDLYNWKWIIIATHNCIQNFMVSSLRNGNNLKVLEDKSSKRWLEEFKKRMKSKIEDWKFPKEKLDYFLNLYEKIKSDKMLMFTISKKLEADKSKDEAIEWLNWHRNKFIHFVPEVFEINVIHFPKRMLLIMEILKFLVSESGNILWLNFEDKETSENLIKELVEKFNQLNQNYTSDANAT
jgi:hypothetical protein